MNFPDPFSRSVQTLTSLTGRFSFLSCLGENILTGIEDCEIGPTTIVCCARIKTKIFKTTTNDSNIYLKGQFSTVSISNQRFFLLLLNFAPWLVKKLAPASQPIRWKTKNHRNLVIRVFRRFKQFAYFALSSYWFMKIWCKALFWLVARITGFGIFGHSVETVLCTPFEKKYLGPNPDHSKY